MNLLFVVSSPGSRDALLGLSGACVRGGQPFNCFVTGEGVSILNNPEVVAMLRISQRAVVCDYSWRRHFPDHESPIEVGSQTDHSVMVGEADQVLSL